MDADTKRNIECCDEWIKSFKRRIQNAEATGEDVDDLKRDLKGYEKSRAGFLEDDE